MDLPEGLVEIKDFNIYKKQELYSSMAIPSTVHSYSNGVEYMKNWFLGKFQNYFKSVHIEGKHAFDDFRRFNKDAVLKRDKPALAIIANLSFDYDREKLDSYPYGIDHYLKRSDYEGAFFKDRDKNLFIGMSGEQMQINFTFKSKVSSRAQQLDLYKFMQMAMRVGYTQGEYTSMDFHIPYSIIIQLAQDAGFNIVDNKVVNIIKFIKYLNSHSEIPITYKLRTINGRNEYFLHIKDVYTHISCQDPLTADDGEREGMISNNFVVELNAVLKIPAPKMYIYYSETEHNSIETAQSLEEQIGLYSVKIVDVPEINEMGWNQYLTTEYFEEDINNVLSIDFNEFFRDHDLGLAIDYCNILKISPSVFLDVKVYNQENLMESTIDWETLILTTKTNPIDQINFISIYVDTNYLYKVLSNIENSIIETIPIDTEDMENLNRRYRLISEPGAPEEDDNIIKI